MGFATSRAQARQLVSHGHFAVNGRADHRALVPGARWRPDRGPGDSRKTEYFKQVKDTLRGAQRPDWLNVDADKLAGNVSALPRRDQMPLELNEQLVVEYYSR